MLNSAQLNARKYRQLRTLDYAIDYLPRNRLNFAVDVGANEGKWSRRMGQVFSSVHAFEPCAKLYEQRLLPLAQEYKNIKPFNLAIGNMKGCVNLCRTKKKISSLSYFVREEKKENYDGLEHKEIKRLIRKNNTKRNRKIKMNEIVINKVQIVSLDSLEYASIDLLKIDVEGLEEDVLRGARELILKSKPVVIVERSEYGNRRYGFSRNSSEKLLREWGAHIVYFNEPDAIYKWKETGGK